MTTWPEDEELSRLYREMPKADPSATLKSRVMVAAEAHASTVRNAKGKRAQDRADRPRLFDFLFGWQGAFGLAATVVVAVTAGVMLHYEGNPGNPGTAGPAEAQQSGAKLPTNVRLAEVEPALPGNAAAPHHTEGEAASPGIPSVQNPGESEAAPGNPNFASKELPPGATPDGKTPKPGPNDIRALKALGDIRALKEQGKIPAAREMLQKFKQGHPDYRLPDDLKDL